METPRVVTGIKAVTGEMPFFSGRGFRQRGVG